MNLSWAEWLPKLFSVVPLVSGLNSHLFADSSGRAGRPEEIAAPVLLLASRGGMYMNDTCINIDGGRWLVSRVQLHIRETLTSQVMKGIYDGLHLPVDSYID